MEEIQNFKNNTDSLRLSQIIIRFISSLSIFAVTVFGNLFGVVGMLFSVPVFVVIKMMVKDFLREKEKSKVALENEK